MKGRMKRVPLSWAIAAVATAAAIGSLIGGSALASNTRGLQTTIVHKFSRYGPSGGYAKATCPRGVQEFVGGGGVGQSHSGGVPVSMTPHLEAPGELGSGCSQQQWCWWQRGGVCYAVCARE